MNPRFVIKDPARPDVTHERLALLIEAGKRIGSSLDIGQTGRDLMQVAVPGFADAGGILVQDRIVTDDEFPVRSTDGSATVRRIAVGVADVNPDDWAAAFPIDEVTVYPAWTPYAHCMATGRPVLYTSMETSVAEEIAIAWKREVIGRLLEHNSVLIVPLKARGRVLGFVVFTRKPGARPFDADDVALGEELAARTAICIDNARLYHRERSTALTLQSSLLPSGLPTPLGLEIASRYLPASDLTGVGGDWFDVIPLPGCRAGLVVGDVMGHGTRAAATMGQLRTALRTLASLDLTPAEVLFRLNRMTQDMDATQIATCVYAVYDPVTQVCSLANAGHVPPILLRPDGGSDVLRLPPGLPLGIGRDPFETTVLTLPEGAVLALCTDGLVESRERDIDAGIAALREVLSTPGRDLEDICDHAISSQRRGHDRDDIALLLARVVPLSGDEFAAWELPVDRRAARQARVHARETLAAWRLDALADTTELLVSELVTNAILHGSGPIHFRMLRGKTLYFEVADRSPATPAIRRPGPEDASGRGLQLINGLGYRWGSRRTPTGKTVWCEQHLPTRFPGDDPRKG
ncbi:ATP-binding SpoIIE family protein phosphatase [Rhizohabitans arisaemae]|uniref:ATP-binding SpoIIE family protein phosphatase n=1 Tax=Rhizohabitans arisaemae TaxID=2720610 RepID=UPI0024B265FA|nr:SpoIIE family protein phosphatase [Rhizohabitans arisaemae]